MGQCLQSTIVTVCLPVAVAEWLPSYISRQPSGREGFLWAHLLTPGLGTSIKGVLAWSAVLVHAVHARQVGGSVPGVRSGRTSAEARMRMWYVQPAPRGCALRFLQSTRNVCSFATANVRCRSPHKSTSLAKTPEQWRESAQPTPVSLRSWILRMRMVGAQCKAGRLAKPPSQSYRRTTARSLWARPGSGSGYHTPKRTPEGVSSNSNTLARGYMHPLARRRWLSQYRCSTAIYSHS